MARYVEVRYLVPVYATVDLDAEPEADDWYPEGSVVKVFEADESIVRIDHAEGIAAVTSGDALALSYEGGYSDLGKPDENVDPTTLSPGDREKAFDIAEKTIWPAWTSG